MKKTIPKIWYDELVDLCYVQSHSGNEKLMVLYLDKWLRKMGNFSYEIDNVGNIIVTKGKTTTYPCIVSHMDTVHTFVDPYAIFTDKKKKILFAQSDKNDTGIGGDDKCGILACLYFLKTLPAVKVVFFTQEESGLKGSNRINKSFFADCRYIIQLDRWGHKYFIDTKRRQKTVSHNFSSEIGHVKKAFEFKSTEGSITDCVNLWLDGVGISCVNISSGFYNPHTDIEYIVIDELWHSIMFVAELIKTLKPKRYVSIKKQTVWKSDSYSYSITTHRRAVCSKCKVFKLITTGIYVNNKFICQACNTKTKNTKLLFNVEICSICNKEKDVTKGKRDGEIFTCNNCLESLIGYDRKTTHTEICDVCQEETPIIKGVYNNSGESFVCYKCGQFGEKIK